MSNGSAFDPETFLNTQHEGALDTKLIPVPDGEYTAIAEKLGMKEFQDKNTGERRVILEVTWNIDNDDVRQVTKRDKVTARQSVFLDLTPEGGLDFSKGKNIELGRLREALGQNRADRPWTMRMIEGQVAKIATKGRYDKDRDDTFVDVFRVSPL